MNSPAFQQFQQDFGRHLRDPHHVARPAGVPARGAAVYGELLFNNVTGFLDACFPVGRQLLGEARWRRLNRAFFRDWRSHTPWFREIPHQFVRYLESGAIRQPLPRWFAELALYEWAELAVDVMEVSAPAHDPDGDLLVGQPLLNPAQMRLAFHWPVHRISLEWRPRRPEATHLLVYRDRDDAVQFAELNPVTARLLELLTTLELSGREACLAIAGELAHPDPQAVLAFGADILADLRRQEIILGTHRNRRV